MSNSRPYPLIGTPASQAEIQSVANQLSGVDIYASSNLIYLDNILLKKYNGSKVRLGSIDAQINIINKIHDTFPNITTEELRKWIRLLTSTHPKIDTSISTLKYFQPVSEEVASRILSKYYDTPSLNLEDWPKTATSLRKIVKNKMLTNDVQMVEESYLLLNNNMLNNLSNEFTEERKNISTALTIQGRNTLAHDFHLAGDITYGDLIGDINFQNQYHQILNNMFGDVLRLINHITTINISENIVNDMFVLKIEDKIIIVSMKGDQVVEPAANIDDSNLVPEIEQ